MCGGFPVLPKPLCGVCRASLSVAAELRRRTFQQSQEAGWTQAAACFRAAVGAALPHRQVGRAGGGWASESCGRGGSGSGVIGASLSALFLWQTSPATGQAPQPARPQTEPPTDPGAPPGQAVHGGAGRSPQAHPAVLLPGEDQASTLRPRRVRGAWWGEGSPTPFLTVALGVQPPARPRADSPPFLGPAAPRAPFVCPPGGSS